MNDPVCHPHYYVDGDPVCQFCQPVLHAYVASGRLEWVLDSYANPFDLYEFRNAWTTDSDLANGRYPHYPLWDRRWAMISASVGYEIDPDEMFVRCGYETPHCSSHRGRYDDWTGRWIPVTAFTGMPMFVSSGAPGGPWPKTV